MKYSFAIKQLNFLLGINLVIFGLFTLLILSQGAVTGEDQVLVFGMLNTFAVEQGMLWLLLTSSFLHFELIHFILNFTALIQIGNLVDTFYEGRKLFITYILSGLASGIATLILALITDDVVRSVGASGAIFGLLGLLLGGTFKKNRFSASLPIDRRSLYPTLALAVVISFLPNINWAAHFGGLAMGIVLGLIFENNFSFESPQSKKITNILFWSSILVFVSSYLLLLSNLIFEIIKI